MDLLAGLMTGRLGAMASTPGPADDYWYNPVGITTAAGLRIDEHAARKISAWYRGRDILATSLAMLPLITYRRLPNDEGREAAPLFPLYDLLHRKPNVGQDSFQWRREATGHVIDYGWHFSEIIEGPRGYVDQLLPIHPTRVTVEPIESGPNRGRLLFHVKDPKTHVTATKTQDEIFYLRGADGKGILEYARDSLGLGVVLESYASKLFSRGALAGGVLEMAPGPMNAEAMRTAAQSFRTAMGDWHMPRVLPQGAKFTPSMIEPEKAQMLLSRKFSVVDVARWLGLPAHMLNEVDTAGVTGLEQKAEDFVVFSLGGWLSMWEFGINDQLILRPETYYAEFTRDALSRGKLIERWQAHVAGVNAGIKTPNEARRTENLRAMPGGDTLREPRNITGRGAKGGPQDNQRPGRDGDPDDEPKGRAIAVESAARVLRKEIAAVRRLAVRHAADGDAFAAAVTEFYARHAPFVAETLCWAEDEAQQYCAGQASQVVSGDWVAALALWKTEGYAAGLAGLAIDEEAA